MDAITPTRQAREERRGRTNLSAVSSNRRFFAEKGIDLSSNAQSRRWYDLLHEYLDMCSDVNEVKRALCRRLATIQCVLEMREADFVKSGKQSRDQAEEYQKLTSSHSSLLKRLGLIGVKAKHDDGDGLDPIAYAKAHKRKSVRTRLDDDDEEEED